MKIDRRLILHFDWTLLILVLIICLIGLINIYSAGYTLQTTSLDPLYVRQARWISLGLVFLFIAFLIDYRTISRYAYIIYGVSILLLILVLIFGKIAQGAQRWLILGGLNFQPSELVKLTLILALARYFDDHRITGTYRLRDLVVPIILIIVPFALILRQPDLGTAMILMFIGASIILFTGIYWKSLIIGCFIFLSSMPIGWNLLLDYQKERLITFFNPERDPLGSGYHIIQSIIAIGSGGITGKGFLHGSQTQLKFLPEQQTDFVFSVLAEEWGILGGFFVILLFFILLSWGLKIAFNSRDILGTIIAFGITIFIAWGFAINVGMVLGILPVVGVPLPFLSYGGSSVVVLMISVGMLMSISVRRFVFQP